VTWDKLVEILRPDFLLHHALYGSVVVGLVCPLVGVYFLLRRLVFWGVALPEVSAAGIACAFLLQGFGLNLLAAGGEAQERHLAIAGSVLFTIAAILGLVWLDRRGKGATEGRVGAVYAVAAALSILFVAWNAAGETEMLGLLKGEIVTISDADFRAMLGAFAATAVCFLVFQSEFLLVSYDRDMAVTLGRRVLHTGPLGTASRLKVMTNYLCTVHLVALAEARGKIDGIQDGGDLAPVHETDNGLDRALARDGHDAPRGRQPMRGRLTDGKAGEGSQRRQAGIAGSCRVVARALQMVEKGEDRIGIQVFELELVDGFVAMLGQESQQQPESVSVGADGVDAEVALSAEVVAEKAFDKRGKGVHGIKDWAN